MQHLHVSAASLPQIVWITNLQSSNCDSTPDNVSYVINSTETHEEFNSHNLHEISSRSTKGRGIKQITQVQAVDFVYKWQARTQYNFIVHSL